MRDELLRPYPVVITFPVAWGEMDAFLHVNNAVYFRYAESGRIAYFQQIGYLEMLEQEGFGPILAAISCKFKAPLTYPDTVSVGTRFCNLEHDRFTAQFVVVSHQLQRVAAEGEGKIVSYNYRQLAKAPLPDVIRQRIEALENGG